MVGVAGTMGDAVYDEVEIEDMEFNKVSRWRFREM